MKEHMKKTKMTHASTNIEIRFLFAMFVEMLFDVARLLL